MVEDDPDGDIAALDAPVTGFDALMGFAALTALDAFSGYDAVIDPEISVANLTSLTTRAICRLLSTACSHYRPARVSVGSLPAD